MTSLHQLPQWAWFLGGCLAAAVPTSYRILRPVVTLVHESGHALVGLLAGRRVSAIRIWRDTSGETVSTGKNRGLGVCLTLLAGYPAPGVLALGASAAVRWHMESGLVAVLGFLALCGLLVLRNLFALVVLAASMALTGLLAYRFGAAALQPMLLVCAGFFAIAGVRGGVEQLGLTGRLHDAAALARMVSAPVRMWQLLFLICCLASAIGVAWLLSPYLPTVLRSGLNA